jgi:hypothetical protein
MGGDSAASNGSSLDLPAVEKVIRKGELLIGVTGSFRALNLITHSLELPKCDPKADPEKWLVNIFVEQLRRCLSDGGNAKKEAIGEGMDCNLLVGFRGSLYCVEGDYLVLQLGYGYGAMGSGADVALGSLYSTKNQKPLPRVRTALEAAERFTSNVRAPFKVKKL